MELIRSGQIRSIRIGRQLRVPKDAVLDFLARQNS
ncbi:MAG: helix-turn-helix domain-containing protein [Oscillospiraceae bacterium]|nr:helix-turn-helix domain-containing protein [Oscillospiraceae bacterium]